MLLVPNISPKDTELAIKNLKWQKELDGKVDFDCLLAYDEAVPKSAVEEARDIASSLYRKVSLFPYPTPQNQSWPAAPNYVWQSCARFIAHFHKKLGSQEWLFLEADAIPISKGWLKKLADSYKDGRRPFLGHVVDGMGHFNGVAVYPHDVARFAQEAMMISNVAWDVVLGQELRKHGTFDTLVTNEHILIMHVWAIDKEGKPTNDASIGHQATFTSEKDVWKWVNLDASIFHRNKDGTLIDWLRNLKQWQEHPELINVPKHAPVAPTPEVVQSQPVPASPSAQAPAPIIYKGKAEILVVTHWRDCVEGMVCKSHQGTDKRCRPGSFCSTPWLRYFLAAAKKYLSGFSGITLAVPEAESDLIYRAAGNYDVRIVTFPEIEGKGFLEHEIQVCSGDLLCPHADIIVHFDPDGIFVEHTPVDEYVVNKKPVMLKRTYTGLVDGRGVVSDCQQWWPITEMMLGFKTNAYTMCRLPSVHPKHVYPEFRKWIEGQHHKPFRQFMLEGKNSFPQTRVEYPALGAFAWEFFRDDYHWIDIDVSPPPKDKIHAFWSHAGITDAIRADLEKYIA